MSKEVNDINGGSHVDFWRKNAPGRRICNAKTPTERACLVWEQQGGQYPGAERKGGRTENEMRKVSRGQIKQSNVLQIEVMKQADGSLPAPFNAAKKSRLRENIKSVKVFL